MGTRKRVFISFKFSDSKFFAEALAESLKRRNFDVDICTDPQMNKHSIFEFEQKIKTDDFVVFIMTNPWAVSFDCAYEASLWFAEKTKNPLNCQCYVAPDFQWNRFNSSFNVDKHIFKENPERVNNAEDLTFFYLRHEPYDQNLVDASATYLNCIRNFYPQFLAHAKGVGMRPYQYIEPDVLATKEHPTPSLEIGSKLYDYVENLTKELEAVINDMPTPRPISLVSDERISEPSPVWLPDAENAKDTSEVRYRNYYKNISVNAFLQDPNLLCISAVKGIGKTFLLQIKRSTISTDENSFRILPLGKPSAENDWGTARITIANNYKIRSLCGEDFEATSKNFEFLWSITIKAYIICQFRYIPDQVIQDSLDLWEFGQGGNNADLEKLNAIIEANSDKNKSYEVNLTTLQEAIIKRVSEYKLETRRLILELWDDKLGDVLNQIYFRRYNCKFALFIDKIDAAFDYLPDVIKKGTSDSASTFLVSDIYQFSLYTTAKKLKEATKRIFVYHAIREETLSRMRPTLGDASGKILNSLFQLQYTSADLKGIFETTVQLQDDKYFLSSKNSEIAEMGAIERFLGVSSLQHPCCYLTNDNGDIEPVQEPLFDCINRHSFGATRDLQYFGMKLSAVTCSQRDTFLHLPSSSHVRTIKQTIEDSASALLFDDLCCAYIPRKKELMPKLYVGEHTDFEPLKTLLKMFNRNFLTKKEIDTIKRRFKKKYQTSANPISVLYRLGLLGILVGDGSKTDYYIQQFENPNEIGYFRDEPIEKVEKANYFVLHPAVTKYIVRETSSSFYRFNGFVIGRDYRVKGSIIAEIESYFSEEHSIGQNKFYVLFSPSSPLPCAIN